MDVRIWFISLRIPYTLLSRSFDRGLQYAAKSGSRYTDPDSVRQVLEYPFTVLENKVIVISLVINLIIWENICHHS